MQGAHICVYIDKFKERYHLLQEKGLIWTNPRFSKDDTCDTYEEAKTNRQFRFKHIINPDSGETLFELEHEARALRHYQYMKPLAQ